MSASVATSKRAAPAAGPDSADPDRTFRSLQYGLGLLRLFTAERPVWGIAEMARALNVDRATAHRYAATCLELGYLEQALTRRYRLTRRCAEPGLAVLGALGPMRAAPPILRELRRRTGRTVSLAVLDGDRVLYLQRLRGFARGQYQLEKGLGAGSRLQAGDTAAGRALLGEIEARPPARERKRAAVTKIHRDRLTVDEQDAGARGLAIVVAAGADGDEPASAIEITVPAESLSAAELVAELGEPLRAARAALQAALEALEGEESEEERVA
jgi:IclR family transcriptional regulator, pca regulon regulatory protein